MVATRPHGNMGIRVKVLLKKLGVIIAASLVIHLVSFSCHYRSNSALHNDLEQQVNSFLASFPEIPDNENGMIVFNDAFIELDNCQIDFYELINKVFREIREKSKITRLLRFPQALLKDLTLIRRY